MSTNIRMLLFISVPYFVYQCLNIILAVNAHFFGSSGKGSLRLADCFGRSVSSGIWLDGKDTKG